MTKRQRARRWMQSECAKTAPVHAMHTISPCTKSPLFQVSDLYCHVLDLYRNPIYLKAMGKDGLVPRWMQSECAKSAPVHAMHTISPWIERARERERGLRDRESARERERSRERDWERV